MARLSQRLNISGLLSRPEDCGEVLLCLGLRGVEVEFLVALAGEESSGIGPPKAEVSEGDAAETTAREASEADLAGVEELEGLGTRPSCTRSSTFSKSSSSLNTVPGGTTS